jgi:hypothetical protein
VWSPLRATGAAVVNGPEKVQFTNFGADDLGVFFFGLRAPFKTEL